MATNTKGTLKYRKIQRTPQTGENAGKKKWYATAVTDREMSFEDFVSHISDHGSPYSRGCIHGVLMDALDHLQELVLQEYGTYDASADDADGDNGGSTPSQGGGSTSGGSTSGGSTSDGSSSGSGSNSGEDNEL